MTENFTENSNDKHDISLVARDAPFGNEFTSPLGVCIRSGRLVYYDIDNLHHSESNSNNILNSGSNSPSIQYSFEFDDNQNMPIGMESLEFQATNNKTVLPLITANSPNSSVGNGLKELMMRNGNLSSAEELDLIKNIFVSMQNIDVQRLDSLQTEISDYDPYHRGLVDASSLQRILAKFFKLIPLSAQCSQKLFRLFSTDPKRPRQIKYVEMVQYLTQIKYYMSQNTSDVASLGKSSNAPTAGSSMAQSPFYKRGDAKIILELQLALQQAKVNNIDVESVRRALNVLDRGHSGTLSREQIENVLKSFKLYSALEQVVPQLLQRCNLSNDDQYDWSTIVRFLEKAQPSKFQETGPNQHGSKSRRDMVSSLDSPTNSSASSYFPPIANNFHVQQNGYTQSHSNGTAAVNHQPNNISDHRKLLEETEMQMKALTMRRQQLEIELAKRQKQIGTESVESKKIDNRPRSAGKLIEQLKKLDITNSGFVPMSNARKVIQQYNDLHELGLNSKFLQHILTLCANDNETHVNLQQLTNYINNSFK